MIKIEPRVMGGICLTTHPEGCFAEVRRQIEWLKNQPKIDMPKRVVVIGCSGGYGLASMISALFGGECDVVGLSMEKSPTGKRTGSPGYYTNACVLAEAKKAGRKVEILDGDAFSVELKERTVEAIKEVLGGQVDLLVYSLASPVRTDPKTETTYRSVLKPIGKKYEARGVDFMNGVMNDVSLEPATQEECDATVRVMGGEDWLWWIEHLKKADVLAKKVMTVAYSYIGPTVTFPIYRNGTIGKAKEDLDRTVSQIDHVLEPYEGKSYVSVNKALVTRASSVIPVVPLYMSLLFKIMKEKGIHEGCIEQIYRLYHDRLYASGEVPVDEEGRIRIDDWEMREDVQKRIESEWDSINEKNLLEMTDLEGFRRDFLQLHGFEMEGIDYTQEVETDPCQKS